METLLILGAGGDKTKGIDFPTMDTLLASVANYSLNEGKEVDTKLRSMLPGLRFTFNSMITHALDKIVTRDIAIQKVMIQKLKDVTNNDSIDEKMKHHAVLLVKLFEKLVSITQNAELDSEIEALIKDVFEDKANEYLGSEAVIDINKLSLSETFKIVLKETLKLSLQGKDHRVAQVLGGEMLSIESLLIEKFMGFYTGKVSDIKSYIYISWMLWSYLVTEEKRVRANNQTIPFYSSIPTDWNCITLNYTSFISDYIGQVIYFHGGLSEYVNMSVRQYMPIEDYKGIDIISFFDDYVKENTDISDIQGRKQKCVIPAFVPPLKIKPVLSYRYIETWHEASEWIRNADRIIIIGYSFSSADDHFNDIIRKNINNLKENKQKEIFIIGPDVNSDTSLQHFADIFSCPKDNWTKGRKQGKPWWTCNNINLIQACADEIKLADI